MEDGTGQSPQERTTRARASLKFLLIRIHATSPQGQTWSLDDSVFDLVFVSSLPPALFNPGCAIILPPVYERVCIMRDSKLLDAMSKKTLHRAEIICKTDLG